MRSLLASSAIVFLVLSGCFGSSGKTDTSTTTRGSPVNGIAPPVPYVAGPDGALPASAYPGQLPVFEERYVGTRGGGEPTVGINKKGEILFPTIAFDVAMGNLASTRVLISKDEGRTWADKTPFIVPANGRAPGVPAAPTSLDPYVYADPVTDRLYNIDLNLAAGGFLSYTDNAGESWTSNPGCCGLPVDDHQSLFAGPATTLVSNPVLGQGRILYFCINQVGATSCTHSLDSGLTWSDGVPAYPGAETPSEGNDCKVDPNNPEDAIPCVCGGLNGHGHASEKTGTVFVPKGQCGKAEVARSTNNGLTFTQVVVDRSVGIDGHEAIVSTDKAGNVYYFFLDRQTYPRLSISRDDGVTWSSPINVTAPGVTAAKFPSIVAGDTGRIAFLYLATTTPHGSHVGDVNQTTGKRQHESEYQNATWNAYVGFSLNANDESPVFATVTAHDVTDPLARGSCSGRCFGTDNGGMYDFLDIDIHPTTGQVYVALIDNCGAETPFNSPPCNGPRGMSDSYQHSRAAVGVQVGGTMLGSALP
ncbi:MAG TPA: sialidase family protein [Candidatus Thermoplasmatota archaeon]|nr:sialidase family protein [Candidatus Thermoplasmatota archaeon]